MHAVRVRGLGIYVTYLQPKAPAPIMRMEEGAGSDSGGLGEDMLDYGFRGGRIGKEEVWYRYI